MDVANGRVATLKEFDDGVEKFVQTSSDSRYGGYHRYTHHRSKTLVIEGGTTRL